MLDKPLNIISHSTKPSYQAYLTKENKDGINVTMPQQNSFRRRSMMSRFIIEEQGPKNHKEFYAANKKQPVSLYGISVGQFNHAAGVKTHHSKIMRGQMASSNF